MWTERECGRNGYDGARGEGVWALFVLLVDCQGFGFSVLGILRTFDFRAGLMSGHQDALTREGIVIQK